MAAVTGTYPLLPFRVLTLSDQGWRNLDIFDEDGRILYTVQTIKTETSASKSISSVASRIMKGGFNDVLAIIEWGGKKAESIITYKGKKCELRDLLTPKEWQ